MDHLSKSNLFIPQKIKVGYQNRDGTYTGKLAYVIYYDNKGKLRKEASWESWRNKNIEPDEFDNSPMEGFVLNKKVGGYSNGWGDFRQAYVRVYDPRGFEFEITVPNLLFILEHNNSIKGKGLDGEFVYAWDGTDLVLLPVDTPDYTALADLNAKRFRNESIKAKDLKVGGTYLSNQNNELVYMGRFDYYDTGYTCGGQWFQTCRKALNYGEQNNIFRAERHLFGTRNVVDYTYGAWGSGEKRHCFYVRYYGTFAWHKSLSGILIDTVSEAPASDYAELFSKLECTTSYSPPDPERDVQESPSIDEVRSQIGNYYWGSYFTSDGATVRIRKDPHDLQGNRYICSFDGDPYERRLSKMFDCLPDQYGGYDMVPISLEDILEKVPLQCTRQYLANGKYYRTVYT